MKKPPLRGSGRIGVNVDVVLGEVKYFVSTDKVGDDAKSRACFRIELPVVKVPVGDELAQGRKGGVGFDFEDKYLLAAVSDCVDPFLG